MVWNGFLAVANQSRLGDLWLWRCLVGDVSYEAKMFQAINRLGADRRVDSTGNVLVSATGAGGRLLVVA